MKKELLLAATLIFALWGQAAEVEQSGYGVTVRPDGGQARVVRLEVMNDNIIRVRATSENALPKKRPSLMIVPQTAPAADSYTYRRTDIYARTYIYSGADSDTGRRRALER